METQVLEIDMLGGVRDIARQAAAVLRAGEVVALPTETVYGLAADATNEHAVAKIFAAKGRPAHDPLIVHVAGTRSLEGVALVPEEIARDFARLTEAFWPGPLTVVLPRGPAIPDIVAAGLPSVAVRASASPVLRAVIRELGGPLAAPSANRFGRISPTTASAVLAELGGRIPLVVDGGASRDGLESTIVRLRPGPKKPFIEILRAGPVTLEMLKTIGKVEVVERVAGLPEVPGQIASHYAPATPLLTPTSPAEFAPEPGKRYGLLSFRGDPADGFLGLADWAAVEILSPGSGKLPEAGVRFFALLRRLDNLGLDTIVAEPLPGHGVGLALRERLRRASHRTPISGRHPPE
jgi:L-threonylcarbamoyladenylate synthase